MNELIKEARELCGKATPGKEFVKKFAEIKRIINDVRTESEKLARTKQCYTCALGNQDETGTYCENAADDYDCEDEGCSNFVDGSVSYAKIAEDDLHTVLETLPELCNALEKAQAEARALSDCNQKLKEQNRRLIWRKWIPVTEQLPTERGYYLAVIKRIAPDELGGNLTNVKIMRWLGEDWRYPLHIPEWINEAITETVTHWMEPPAPPEEGAEHERD